MENTKKLLSKLSDNSLEFLDILLQTTTKEEILLNIHQIQAERKEEKQGLNSKYLVEDMVLDWPLLQKLKNQNINTLQDILEIGIENISGLYPSEREQLDWAVLFFDMRPLEKLPKDATKMDVVTAIVKQGKEAEKQMIKKYGHKV